MNGENENGPKRFGYSVDVMLVLSAVGLVHSSETGPLQTMQPNRGLFLLHIFALFISLLAAIAGTVAGILSRQPATRSELAANLDIWTYRLFYTEAAAFAAAVCIYVVGRSSIWVWLPGF